VALRSNIFKFRRHSVPKCYNEPAQNLALQSDFDAFKIWCNDNNLNLNGSKYKEMTFFRVSSYYTDYTLSGYELDRITHVDDLGVYMDPNF